jgi:hypothetical protein
VFYFPFGAFRSQRTGMFVAPILPVGVFGPK